LNLYPDKDESDKLNTTLLFFITLISGLIGLILCKFPPLDAILTTVGGSFLQSMYVDANLILLSSILYTKYDPVDRPLAIKPDDE
jgi:hypothetical protein